MRVYNFLKSKVFRLNSSSGGGGTVNRDPKAIMVKREGFQINESGGGRDNFEEPDVDFEVIDNAIAADSYVMRAMLRHSELISKSGYHFKTLNEQALEYLKLRLTFMEVGTGIKTEILIQEIIDDLVRYSNAFFIKARSKSGEGLPPGAAIQPIPPSKAPIAGYFRVHPKTITIARDDYGEVLKYKQEVPGGEEKDFNPEDVIHFTLNKPSGRAFSLPWIAPVLEDIRLLRKIEENVAVLIYKHIFPLIKYQIGLHQEGKEATDNEIDEAKRELESLPVDGMVIMPERHDIETLKLEPIDIKDYLSYFENRVFSGLGLSQIDMGRGDTANRNTADSMDSQKIDRIKNWQMQIQSQIDQYIIDELLVEGGFDPLVNPDFDVDFIFEEIENEKKIALENHVINKFNNNMLTFEEARLQIGEDVAADEGRLHFNMFGKSGEDGSVENASQPENQHGKKDGPTKTKESVLQEGFKKEKSSFIREFEKFLISSYELMRSKKKSRIIFESNINEQSVFTLIERNILAGSKTRSDYIIKEYSREWINKTLETMTLDHKEALKEKDIVSRNIELSISYEKILRRATQFDEYLQEKIEGLNKAEDLLTKGFEVVVESETDCSTCRSFDGKTFSLSKMTEMEKKSLFYSVPPYHSNCNCKLIRKE